MNYVEYQRSKRQRIVFLDSKDFRIRTQGLLLRCRTRIDVKSETELTLKCRSPDFCVASAHACPVAPNVKAKAKFEEDVASPFRSSFSRSTTASIESPTKKTAEISNIFPMLSEIKYLPKRL